MKISLATENDARDLWNWRNDELTRTMSITTDFVKWEDHSSWFMNSLQSKNRLILIGFIEQKKVGMVKFDSEHDKKSALVSINLNPEERGKRLSIPLLLSAIIYFQNLNPYTILATVKKQNLASIKCFIACKFIEVDSDDLFYYYKLETKLIEMDTNDSTKPPYL